MGATTKKIGLTLKKERENQALTQTELAELTGIRRETISKIETGAHNFSLESIVPILQALKMELSVKKSTI